MLDIYPVPAFTDNYIWLLHNGHRALAVDPGEAGPVLTYLKQHGLSLCAILCTHHHGDHVGGLAELCKVYNVPVYGPREENIPGVTVPLGDGDRVKIPELDLEFDVMDVRGHTRGHIAYLLPGSPGSVFCGDTLFGCGCGRLFEGTMEQLHHSLQRLAGLPGDTRVYCAHEYTEANIRFALACEPGNQNLQRRASDTRALRNEGKPSLPSTIALEKTTNPFLRCDQPEVIHAAQQSGNTRETDEFEIFSALRNWKNHFS
jgi:hydroxyacylglutathione hydrolase